MNEALSEKWGELRGLKVVSIALGSVTLPPEDAEMIKQLQRTAVLQNPTMAGAALVGAQADAMKAAAANESGAMNGFIGMGMAMNAGGGVNPQNLFAMGQAQNKDNSDSWKCSCGATVSGNFCPECGCKKPAPVQSGVWRCKCGATVSGKFCSECGSPKPADTEGWTCSCGTINKGKFCQECGAKKPDGVPQYRCDKCGWEVEKGATPPKFCPECGDPFDDGDMV